MYLPHANQINVSQSAAPFPFDLAFEIQLQCPRFGAQLECYDLGRIGNLLGLLRLGL